MKKQLLLLAMGVAALASQAGVDPSVYETVDGITFTNKWLVCRTLDNNEYAQQPYYQDFDRVRTATITDDKIYLGYSHKLIDEATGELNSGSAHLIEFDLMTGEYLRTIQCSYEGATIDGLLCANQVGVDDFGHIWFAGYRQNIAATAARFYYVTNLETGECEAAFDIQVPEDEADCGARVDYYDLVGDITRTEAGCKVMACSCEEATDVYVYGWSIDQGSAKVEPHMNDGEYVATAMLETYPEGQTMFSYGSMVYIVRDEDFSANNFYVDGFTTVPALYDTSGQMIDSFADVEDGDLIPKLACNGAYEFDLAGKKYLAYPIIDTGSEDGYQYNIAQFGEDLSFASLKKMWNVPQIGLGTISDGGMRVHPVHAKHVTDANGKEGVYVFNYKCYGGMGLYLMAEEGFEETDGVAAVEISNNAAIEYFNLNGRSVSAANLTPGLYISRQGEKVQKVIIR